MARRESTPESPGSRALIVDLVRSSGPISRVELTQATGLTQPAVSVIVRKLLDDGVIVEKGLAPSTGGKPRRLLDINSRAGIGIGIQLGFDTMTFVATDTNGGVVARQGFWGAQTAPPIEVVQRIGHAYRQFLELAGVTVADVTGVAVVVPGPLDHDQGGIVEAPTLPAWTGFPLRQHLEEMLATPVLVDNDASAAALGEFWSRGISRYSTFGAIYLGTGIGAGVVTDGSLYRGASSNATEIGHISVDSAGAECACGNYGCLELVASPGAILRAAATRRDELGGLSLSFEQSLVQFDYDTLALAAIAGHGVAEELITQGARAVARATLTFCNLFDLDEIVLTGPAMANAGSIYARETRAALERSFARRSHAVSVDLSANPRDAAAIGGAAMTLQGSLAPGHGPALAFTTVSR